MQAELAQRESAIEDVQLGVAFSADTVPTVVLHDPDEPANKEPTPRAAMEMKAIQEAIARVEAEAKAACAAENRAHAEARAARWPRTAPPSTPPPPPSPSKTPR